MICAYCNGKSCDNVTEVSLDESDEEELDLPVDIPLAAEDEELDVLRDHPDEPSTADTIDFDINEPDPSGLCR